jgi:hypothetical protein
MSDQTPEQEIRSELERLAQKHSYETVVRVSQKIDGEQWQKAKIAVTREEMSGLMAKDSTEYEFEDVFGELFDELESEIGEP